VGVTAEMRVRVEMTENKERKMRVKGRTDRGDECMMAG